MALAKKVEAHISHTIFRFFFEMHFSALGLEKHASRGHLGVGALRPALRPALVSTFGTSEFQPLTLFALRVSPEAFALRSARNFSP